MPGYEASHFDPPAPLSQVGLRNPDSGVAVSDVPLLPDTGADITLLPRSAIERQGVRALSNQLYVRFEYPICKLQDFAGDLRALESDPNPIATVIVAHLVAQRTRSNMGVRRRFKGELARRLYDRGWTGVEVLKLFRLIDWLLRLPRELEAEFREDLIHFEKERQMPYVTSIERMGREEGRQEGRQEGRKEGRQEGRQEAAVSLLIRLARKRFPGFGPEDEAAIRQRPLEDLESLAEALLDFQSIADLRQWVGERSQK
jgi:hypothetical protein